MVVGEATSPLIVGFVASSTTPVIVSMTVNLGDRCLSTFLKK